MNTLMWNPKLLLLISIALGMGAYLYFGEFQSRRAQESDALRASWIFPEIAENDIDSISFVTADGYPVSLERNGGQWRVMEPVSSSADQGVVAGLTESLVGLLAQERLADVSAASVYGLGEDARRIRFSAGGTSYGLRLGQTAPVGGGQVYVARDGMSEVALVAQGALQGFDKLLRDYRPRRIFSLGPALLVQRIEISWRKEKAVLEKQEGVWRIATPVRARADQTAVTDLLRQLAGLKADAFVDDPSQSQRASLASPEVILRLEGTSSAEPSEFPLRLVVAGSAGGNRLLVQAEKKVPMLVRASALRTLPKNLGALRDLILSAFPEADAQIVEIDLMFDPSQEKPVRLRFERTQNRWRESNEAASSAEVSEQVQPLIEQLSSLRARSVVAESVGGEERAALHLDPAFMRVRVFGESGNALADLRISDRSLASGQRLLQVGDRPTLYSGEVEIVPFLVR